MRHQKSRWNHETELERQSQPVLLYSEVDDNGWERRKVEEYPDGRLDWADHRGQTGSTDLSVERVPAIAEINQLGPFEAIEMSKDDFESLWTRATTGLDQAQLLRRVERGSDLLVPFVEAGFINANPEDLAEMAFVVLTHAGSNRSATEAYEAAKDEIAAYTFEYRRFELEAYGESGPLEALVRAALEFLADGKADALRRACTTKYRAGVNLESVLEAYGRTVRRPDDDWWATVTVTPIRPEAGGGFHVAAPIWTEEEGRSDLTLELRIFPGPRGRCQAEVLDLHAL